MPKTDYRTSNSCLCTAVLVRLHASTALPKEQGILPKWTRVRENIKKGLQFNARRQKARASKKLSGNSTLWGL